MRSVFLITVLWVTSAGVLSAAKSQPEAYWARYHRAMKEPSIQAAKITDSDFQFRWTRLSGQHEPMAIRVWRRNGKTFCRAIRVAYISDYADPGSITAEKTLRLTDKQIREFSGCISRANFWRPLSPEEDGIQSRFISGARWLVEIKDASGYRFLSTFSPALWAWDIEQHHGPAQVVRSWHPYVDLATFLLKTTKIFPDETEAVY